MKKTMILTAIALLLGGVIVATQVMAQPAARERMEGDGRGKRPAAQPGTDARQGGGEGAREGRQRQQETSVNWNDVPTTMPLPKDDPSIADMDDLMSRVKAAHQKTVDKDPAVALAAAKQVESLVLAAGHERFRADDKEYMKYVRLFYWKNQELQRVLKNSPADRAAVMAAFKGENNACSACHKVYRKED